jgi:hypothetical protein
METSYPNFYKQSTVLSEYNIRMWNCLFAFVMYVSRIHDMFISDINKQYRFQTMRMSDIWNANSDALYMTCDYLHFISFLGHSH